MLMKCRVVRFHPESHSADVFCMDTGRRFGGVHILSQSASGNTGKTDLAIPTIAGMADPYNVDNTWVRDVFALVAMVSRDVPVIVGFIYPEVSQMLFEDQEKMINRHASDVYSTIDGNADTEFYHPSGSYVRFAESPEHNDLTGKDYDKKWAIKENTGSSPDFRLRIANAQVTKATVTIKDNGDITITNDGTLVTIDHSGNIVINNNGTINVDSKGNVSIKAPLITLNANVHVTGSVTVDSDVTASGISLVNHIHTGVQSGGSVTGVPVV